MVELQKIKRPENIEEVGDEHEEGQDKKVAE